jgi:uncharacterized repeat protein (TIGR01451 family)
MQGPCPPHVASHQHEPTFRLRGLMRAMWLSLAILAFFSGGVAHAQVTSSTVVTAPVTPLKVTVSPATLATPPHSVTVPEGGPAPTEPPPPSEPIADPTAQVEGAATVAPDGLAPESLEAPEAPGQLSAPSFPPFPGLTSGSAPPDTTGAVGRTHFVQMVNATSFQVWDKKGTAKFGPANFGNMWPAGNNCRRNDGDPIVVYDHLADRWLLSQFAASGFDASNNPIAPFSMCIAISQTSDPTAGTWFLYTFAGATNFPNFPDYPKFGVWPDGYYMSSYEGGNLGIFVFDRANMLLGNAAAMMRTTISTLTPSAGIRDTRILPADLDGPAPAGGTPNFYVRPVDGQQDTGNATDRLEVYEARTDWNASPSTFNFVLVDTLTPAAFNIMNCNRNSSGVPATALRDCIPLPATPAASVDALSNRPMMQLRYRTFGSSQRLTFNQTINVQGSINAVLGFTPTNEVAGIRWYELEKTGANWTIRQQGTYAAQPLGTSAENDLLHRWMGSMAMDKDGNIALGYSITNGDSANPVFPSLRYTGRRFDDLLGFMPQGEQVILNGTTTPTGLANRWGDYSQMSVDPVDDCTFWYTGHVDSGVTEIGSFRFDTCGVDLAIEKAASPAVATAGATLTYTITVTNNGPTSATNVTVVDTLPGGSTYQADTDSCVQGPPGTLTCNLGTLAVSDVKSFDIQVLVGTGAPGTITNTATVSADQADVDTTNNQASAKTIVQSSADLRITKQCKPDNGPAPTGGTATCTITVDNLGPSNALNVVVTDALVSNGAFTITSATFGAAPGTPCGIDAASGVVTCNLGAIAAGGRVTITVQVTSANQVDVNDTATVTSATPDPNAANNIATGAVSFRGSADLAISKTSTQNPSAGTNVTYVITVANSGPSAAPNVVVKDTLPAQISDVTFTPSQGSCTGGIPGNPAQPLTCTLGSLANGGSATITIVAKVASGTPNGTVIVNNAVVSSDYADPNNANNSATALTTVQGRADLQILKTSDKSVYKPSSLVTFTVTVTNNGPSDALAVVVTDNLPTTQQALYQSDTGGCTKSGLTLTCNLGNMPVGTSRSFNINMVIKGSRGAVSNTATVSSSTTDPNTVNNTATRTVTIGK